MPRTCMRMEVGQPGTGAPAVRGASVPVQAALRGRRLARLHGGIRPRLACAPASASPLPGLVRPRRADGFAHRGHRRRIGGLSPRWCSQAAFNPGDRVALAAPYLSRPTVNIASRHSVSHPSFCRYRARHPLSAERPTMLGADGPAAGWADHRQRPAIPPAPCCIPTNSRPSPAGVTGAGVRLISDEIYHGLQYGPALATAAAFSPSAVVGEQLLEILLHDRLASRLGGVAGGPGAPGGVPGAEPVHFRAAHFPNRRRGRFRRARRAAGQRGAPIAGRARCCWPSCLAPGSTVCRRPRARSTSMPTSLPAPTTARRFAPACCPRQASRRRRAWILTPSAATPPVRFSYCGPEADMAEAVARLRRFR